jgi:hypothetical protein
VGLSGFEPESQGPKPRRLAKLPHNPVYLKNLHAIFKYYGIGSLMVYDLAPNIYSKNCVRFINLNILLGYTAWVLSMPKKEEKYDVEDVIVIEDKKRKDDEFDLGRDDLGSDIDDDDYDFDDMDFDDGGD